MYYMLHVIAHHVFQHYYYLGTKVLISMDEWMPFDFTILFNSISDISRQFLDDNEQLCGMDPRWKDPVGKIAA